MNSISSPGIRSAAELGTRSTPLAATQGLAAASPIIEASPEIPDPSRISFISRKGEFWSYPYHFVGLVEFTSPTELTVFCTCSSVDRIVITGRGLEKVAKAINGQRLVAITESDSVEFAKDGTVVRKITIEKKPDKGA